MNTRTDTPLIRFDDMALQVGVRLQLLLHGDGEPSPHYSTLIGYVPGEFLLAKLPRQNGRSPALREGDRLTVRVFSGISVYSFCCHIESVLQSPRSYMHLSFPIKIEAVELRKEVRVKVRLPMQILTDAKRLLIDAQASATDLSVGGARVLSRLLLGGPGSLVRCRFEVHTRSTDRNCELEVAARVCSLGQDRLPENGNELLWTHGVEFIDIDPKQRSMLQNFVSECLLGGRNIVV